MTSNLGTARQPERRELRWSFDEAVRVPTVSVDVVKLSFSVLERILNLDGSGSALFHLMPVVSSV